MIILYEFFKFLDIKFLKVIYIMNYFVDDVEIVVLFSIEVYNLINVIVIFFFKLIYNGSISG